MPWSQDGIYYRLEGQEEDISPNVLPCVRSGQPRRRILPRCRRTSDDTLDGSRPSQDRKIVDELKWGKVHVVGISMGGMISLELAWLLPAGSVESLALIGTTGNLWNAFPSIKASFFLARAFFTSNQMESFNFFLKVLFTQEWLDQENPSPLHNGRIVSNSRYVRKLFIKRSLDVPSEVKESARYKGTPFVDFNPPTPFRQSLRQLGAILRHRIEPQRLEEIKAKVPRITVIHGEHDLLVPPKNSEFLARQLNATLVMLNAGHGLLEEKEADINNSLSRGIRNEPVQASSLSKL